MPCCAWFAGAALGLAVVMYGAGEALANKVSSEEEYVGALPAIAIVPSAIGCKIETNLLEFPLSKMISVLFPAPRTPKVSPKR